MGWGEAVVARHAVLDLRKMSDELRDELEAP
jgi:hypothetical protein